MNISLKTLQLKAKREVYTHLSGNHLSKLFGEGYDFAELREYQIGDDIRKINWTITAKLGKPYIKELHSNRELSVVVCSLCDGGFYFGEGNDKQKIVTEVATILAYATQLNSDLFMGINYKPNSTYCTPPTKEIYYIEEFSKDIFEANLLGTSLNYNLSIENLFQRVYKPSLIFIIGDFLEEVDLSILAQKHEVIAIIVRDRAEENPNILGDVILSSSKYNMTLDTYFGQKSINKYINRLKKHDNKLQEDFLTYNIPYIKVYTDEDILSKLMLLF
ncbi:hypothetical protein MNB_SV-15-742 [hydrothermal vent metagenome]|uniref:DUF58 domain-containing protein n=1 Tax=hydrothermal vent metagenome TaxID=652676 RepID=A0A1W1EKN5_9ZZZZ